MKKIFSIFFEIFDDITLLLITNMPGRFGIKIRYLYWKFKLKKCGKKVIIDVGVIIENPKSVSLGDYVWIGKYALLTAGKRNKHKNDIMKEIKNDDFNFDEGDLVIGNGVHIGNFNIIQAHTGVSIGNFVTTSASVKIYSLSNYYFSENNQELITYANSMIGNELPISYISNPIVIEDGVWLALNSCVLGGTIGTNSFVATNSIVTRNIPSNSYAKGNPAIKIKTRFKLETKNA